MPPVIHVLKNVRETGIGPPPHLFFVFFKCTMYIYLGAKSRGSDAVQNVWMINSANFVLTKIRPKVFWGENAPGLFTTGIIYIQLIIP